MSLELEQFEEFFRAANTRCDQTCSDPCPRHPRPTPFAWQSACVRQVAEDGVWRDLDVPTGLGKTSLIDIWVFLLAWQAGRDERRTVPLRLFFVVDRRLVVDQAYDHAELLSRRLANAADGTVLAEVAAALRGLGGRRPLEVVRMRGGVDWASRWLTSPAQPALVTATVDQYGSRLLFRGYGASPRMRPIDAALCGTDALLAVDEAHIAQPLLATATDCAAYQRTAVDEALAQRAVQVVSLSATARSAPDRPRLALPAADWTGPVAGRRLNAERRVTLLDASDLAGNAADAFAAAAERAVEALLPVAERPVLGVVANTIAAARAAHRRLAGRDDVDTLLLTGRCRPAERELLLDGPLLRELREGVAPDRPRPLVVVATQTVEVGWDISLAALVTEVPSLDALVQRLGRVNRTGDLSRGPVLVVRCHRAKKPADEERIPVYGAAAARTWDWLAEASPPLTSRDEPAAELARPTGLLVNPATLPRLLEGRDRDLLTAPPPEIPALHATLLAAWSRTAPAPVPDQEPGPFLHGCDAAPPDVQVLWRADVPPVGEAAAAAGWLPPPHAEEMVAVPAAHLKRLLAGERGAAALGDLEQQPPAEPVPAARRGALEVPVMRWRAPDGATDGSEPWRHIATADDIVPGGIYMLPAEFGGHDEHGFTGRPDGGPVPDLGDFPPRARAATRLDARVLRTLTGCGPAETEAMEKAVRAATARLSGEAEELPPAEAVHELLEKLEGIAVTCAAAGGSRFTGRLLARLRHLRRVPAWEPPATGVRARDDADGPGRFDVVGAEGDRLLLVPPPDRHGAAAPAGVSEDADTTAHTSRAAPVTLARHSAAVAERAGRYAAGLDLPEPLRTALRLAGHAHDSGKAHPRFQCRLCGGDGFLAESLEEALAKSGMDPSDRAAHRRADRLAQWSPALRHEALSAAAVRQWLSGEPPAADSTDHELITHLVAAHHGWSRPLLPPEPDPHPTDVSCAMPDGRQVTVSSTAMGTDWAGHDRFLRLNHRYGPWGLALLEATVRLADMACSEEGS